MSRLRLLLLLSLFLLGLAPALQADTVAAPAPGTDNSSTNDLNKGRATIDPNG
jgi:hypothetical protein